MSKCAHNRGAAGYASVYIKECPYCLLAERCERIAELEARQRWYHVNDKLPERGERVFVEFKVPTGYTHYALMTSDYFEHTKYGTRWTYAPQAGGEDGD